MRLWHTAAATSAQFDDPNLVSHAGLVPVMRLAQDCGLAELVGERVTVAGPCGANTPHKIACVVAGMIAGADAIDDLDLLRCGRMGELFDGVRAPSTLGSFLRALSWGNVRQLEAVSRRLLAELAARAPVLPDAAALMWLDVDSCQRRVYGHAKQGAGFGHAKVGGYSVRLRGLNPLIAAISTPTSAPLWPGPGCAAGPPPRPAARPRSWPKRSAPERSSDHRDRTRSRLQCWGRRSGSALVRARGKREPGGSPGLSRSGEWERPPSLSTGWEPGKRRPVGPPGYPVGARESEDLPPVRAPAGARGSARLVGGPGADDGAGAPWPSAPASGADPPTRTARSSRRGRKGR